MSSQAIYNQAAIDWIIPIVPCRSRRNPSGQRQDSHTHTHTRTHAHTHAHTHTHTHIIDEHTHTHAHICTHKHTHTFIHEHTHTFIANTYTHAHARRHADKCVCMIMSTEAIITHAHTVIKLLCIFASFLNRLHVLFLLESLCDQRQPKHIRDPCLLFTPVLLQRVSL